MPRSRTTRLLPLAAILPCACVLPPAKPAMTQAAQSIRETLCRHYLRGMRSLDFEDFAPVFHPDARLAFCTNEGLVLLDLLSWRRRLANLKADKDHPLHTEQSQNHIGPIEISGSIARVEVRFDFPSRRYTDYLQLVRVAGRWQIIHKTFHLELKP